ncbi:class I SAM-dependent methyltransferase [Oricola sp.]|uniref:class I SAM-dependent methyltransferase n=1 Tax=Oricola sp. TaxID=1979950 RepID=UPI0025FDA6B7|nr:class I SAM-dependent methyltransferase [Oricola sp.]MCI5073592.1 class I SAM-dependent methyltransferase [Oricola sp.]
MPDLKQIAADAAKPWIDSTYYDFAETHTDMFWGEGRVFRRMFGEMDLSRTLELACGHGRHAEIVQPMAEQLILMDILPANIAFCRRRLGRFSNVAFRVNDGFTFQPVEDGHLTAIFCYDAMVHFPPELVRSYLEDAARVLAPGGQALFHHSNYDPPVDQQDGLGPHARHRMTRTIFNGFARDAGLEVVASKEIFWGGHEQLDGVSLLRRPAA